MHILFGAVGLLACAASAASAARYWRVHARLGSELVESELRTTTGGDAELLPDGCYGRGCGQWSRRESGVIEGRIQLFLYTIDAQPTEPTELDVLCVCASPAELRGLLFEPHGRRLRLGTFHASLLEAPRLFRSRRHRPRQTAEGALLHAQLPPFRLSPSPRRAPLELAEYRVGGLSAVYYVPDYLSAADEEAIGAQLAASPGAMWSRMQGRRVQECGSHLSADGAGLELEALPPWMARVCARLVRDGVFPRSMAPNSVALNEYSAAQGIAPHADGPIYAPRVVILSLFSPALLRFHRAAPELRASLAWDEQTDTPAHAAHADGPPLECVLLRPRSLLLFSGDAFREHCHEVAPCPAGCEVAGDAQSGTLVNGALAGAEPGDTVERGRRVSLTIRHLLSFLLAPDRGGREPVREPVRERSPQAASSGTTGEYE